MSNIDTMNSQSNLAYLPDDLFTELTPKAAEVVEGGALAFSTTVNFDSSLISREFKNNYGSKITVNLDTRTTGINNPNNNLFLVHLQSFNNGKWRNAGQKFLNNNGGGSITWGGLRNDGERLRLWFADDSDGEYITGSLKVYD